VSATYSARRDVSSEQLGCQTGPPVISGVVLVGPQILPLSTNPNWTPGDLGAEIGVTYQVVDQYGNAMPISGAPVTEDVEGYETGLNSFDISVQGAQFTTTNSAGQFTDPIGVSNENFVPIAANWEQNLYVNGTPVGGAAYSMNVNILGSATVSAVGGGGSGGPFTISMGPFVSPWW
jgi:hypothetical protein